ncbi:MAG: transcription antitermination factor NusB [Chlamydiia bacterium]|nr:transcription antitermination factor NusB [Chlamydiia bacterium]
MALPAQKFREIVFQLLFCSDMSESEEREMIPFMMGELKVTKRVMLDAYARKGAIWGKKDEVDALIRQYAKEYAFERISRVEKNILRLSLYEMLLDESIPEKVAIAEGIRLTRKFGTAESAHFVNAILDAVYHDNQRSEEPIPQ